MIEFSILITVYKGDNPKFLAQALESIYAQQTVKPSEVILVEDGPLTSDLYSVIESSKCSIGKKLTVLKNPINMGLATALNIGITHCKTPYIIRMDADDISDPHRFEILSTFIKENPDIDIVGSYALEIDENDQVGNLRKVPSTQSDIVKSIWLNPFIHPSVAFKVRSISNIGCYDSTLKRRQDYDLWFRAVHSGLKVYNLPMPLIYYRFSEHTHKKQSIAACFEQSVIGFKGCRKLCLPMWTGIFCFIPFIRSLLPYKIQHFLYKFLKKWDPRNA